MQCEIDNGGRKTGWRVVENCEMMGIVHDPAVRTYRSCMLGVTLKLQAETTRKEQSNTMVARETTIQYRRRDSGEARHMGEHEVVVFQVRFRIAVHLGTEQESGLRLR